MPRIQILPLPEGVSDERPPFAVVIDQADHETLHSLAYGVRYDSDHGERPIRDALKDDLGARALLVFADTIEIPANDVSAYATPTMVVRVEGDADSGSADLADQIRRGIEDAQAAYGRTA
ncbi:hypothetical protein [Streptomyces rochei]|uniref:hypothetical protein n=1 Tax=Streptomyces rochei TaxID=1928 RepID=UPI0033ABF924